MFWDKKWRNQRDSNIDSPIPIVVRMQDGRVIRGKASEREYADARYDLGRHSRKEDSRIFILDIIAHPDDFKSIERV